MELGRCLRALAPVAAIALIGAAGLMRPASLHAGDPPWDPPPCPPGQPAAGTGSAWYSLQPVLDRDGWLTGRRLALGELAGGRTRHLDLPPESFASGPVGGRVLVGDDDGTRSRLRAVDIAAGCAIEVGRESSVIRSAVLSADGLSTWEHRVNRTTRADEGVWRRPPGGGDPVRALAAPVPDERYGRTFSTELMLASDGRVAVASCGEVRCRVRVLDPRTGDVSMVEGTGPLLGIAGGLGIAYAACPGLPCPVESIDLRTGHRSTLIPDAGPAALSGAGGGALVHELADGRLEMLGLATGRRTLLAGRDTGSPVRGGSMATSGADLPAGGVLVAPAGRLADPGAARVVDVGAGTATRLAEPRP